MKKILILLPLLISFELSLAQQQNNEGSKVKWMDIETAMKKYHKNPKPLLIDVYTDWCGWCKYMMKTTYANKYIARYINMNFYPVRFNAETRDTIEFEGKKYGPKGKVNTLAIKLLDGRLEYPTTVFFDRNLHKYRIPGYLRIRDIEPLLVYFAEDISESVPLDEFRLAYMLTYPKNYKDILAKIPANQLPDTSGQTHWYSFEQAIKQDKANPKMFLVVSYVPWCFSCKPMKVLDFKDSTVANYVNKHFYAIWFNAAETKPITINGKKYVSLGKGQPHELAMWLFNRQFRFPAMIFLNKNFQIIGRIYGFYDPQQVLAILKYFYNEKYKQESLEKYIEQYVKHPQNR